MERQYLEEDYLYEDEDALEELKEIRMEIDYAKKHGDIERALFLYMDYVHEDVFRLYCKNAIEILPEFMELLDEHYSEYYEHRINVMIGYKWVITAIDDYLSYSLDDIINFYKMYHDLCLKYGYSLRTYYQFLWGFLDSCPQLEKEFGITVEEAHESWLNEPKDRLSDVDSIEDDGEASYLLFIEKNPQKALEIMKSYFNGEKRGREIPHSSYFLFAKYYFENGDLSQALKNAKMSLEWYDKDFPDYSTYISIRSQLFWFLSYRYREKAISIFKRILPYVPDCQSLFVRMVFYISSYQLFVQLEKKNYKEMYVDLPLKIAGENIHENGKYEIAELKELFYAKARHLADMYDERDGDTAQNDRLNKIYEF